MKTRPFDMIGEENVLINVERLRKLRRGSTAIVKEEKEQYGYLCESCRKKNCV